MYFKNTEQSKVEVKVEGWHIAKNNRFYLNEIGQKQTKQASTSEYKTRDGTQREQRNANEGTEQENRQLQTQRRPSSVAPSPTPTTIVRRGGYGCRKTRVETRR